MTEDGTNGHHSHFNPTLGVTPHDIWVENRMLELIRAIEQSAAAGLTLKEREKWRKELREHVQWVDAQPPHVRLP